MITIALLKEKNKMKDFEIRCDESHLEKNNTLYGKFTLGPFLPGQGTTFGNALRRSLLSELSGLSITAFEILGVMQEFATLPGLRESVLDLSLNLKQVVLTGLLPRSIPPIGFINVRGPSIIYASDLKLPPGVYCTSPEQYIATLASNGVLNLKFLVSVGKGHSTQPYSLYRSLSKIKLQPILSANSVNKVRASSLEAPRGLQEQDTPLFHNEWKSSSDPVSEMQKISKIELENPAMDMYSSLESQIVSKKNMSQNSSASSPKPFNLETSTSCENNIDSTNLAGYVNIQKQTFQRLTPHQVLPIDAVFTPVSQVNFLTQINDRFETARENVVLEIWTNGSIHPKRALEEAALSLVQNFDTLLKSIQQASSFYRGLRYWNYLQPFNKKKAVLINSPRSLTLPKLQTNITPEVSSASKVDNAASLTPRGQVITPNTLRACEAAPGVQDKVKFPRDLGFKEDGNGAMVSKQKANDLSEASNSFHLPLHQAVYNLDIGNLDISLETFILLKQAKVKTLANLVKIISSKEKKAFFTSPKGKKAINELSKMVNQLGINVSS